MTEHLQDLEDEFQAASERVGPGNIVYLNQAGEGAQFILDLVERSVISHDLQRIEGAEPGGDCLFSTTYVAATLIKAGYKGNFHLVTGCFDVVEIRPEVVVHAWIEIDDYALNVSNADRRAIYVMKKRDYHTINRCVGYIQRVSRSGLSVRLKKWIKKDPRGVDMYGFAEEALLKTRKAMREQKERLSGTTSS